MKITKILPAQATPAKAILSRAKHVALTSAERAKLPSVVTVNGAAVETDIKDVRPLEVGEVLLDEAGHFYVVEAAPETVLIIKGDEEFAAEAAVALLNRGIAVAQIENGFAIAKDEELQQLLTEAGLEFEEAVMPFEPITNTEKVAAAGVIMIMNMVKAAVAAVTITTIIMRTVIAAAAAITITNMPGAADAVAIIITIITKKVNAAADIITTMKTGSAAVVTIMNMVNIATAVKNTTITRISDTTIMKKTKNNNVEDGRSDCFALFSYER